MTSSDERKRRLVEAERYAEQAQLLLGTIRQAFNESQKILPTNAVKAHFRNGACKASSYEIVTHRLEETIAAPARLRQLFIQEDEMAAARNNSYYKQEPAYENRQEAAVIYLLRFGKQLGLDFHLSNALEAADTAAEFEFIQLQKMPHQPIRFATATPCADQCSGWNPRYQTCVCGRNRMRWQRAHGHCFEQPKLVPIATKAVTI